MNKNEFLEANYKEFVYACGIKYHICKKFIDFDDYKQRTFLRYLKGVGYNPDKGMTKFGFMCMVATNEALEVIRYNSSECRTQDKLQYSPNYIDSEGKELFPEPYFEEDYSYLEVERILEKLYKTLSEKEKIVLEYKLKDLNGTQIANRIGVSQQYVSAILKRIRRKASKIV